MGVAALLEVKGGKCEDVRISVGGATAVPVRAKNAERVLMGQPASEANIARAADAVKDALRRPLGDSYASADFRVHLATVMAKRALTQVAARAR